MHSNTETSNAYTGYPFRRVGIALLLHYLAYVFMSTLAVLAETRRGAPLPDLLLDQFEPFLSLHWINSTFWLAGLLIFLLLLLVRYPASAINYLRVGALVSVARGVFILLTSLGPPPSLAGRINETMASLTLSDISFGLLLRHWLPVDVLWGGSGLSAAYLTQDLLFSGHTSSSFLFLLLVRKPRSIFYALLVYHVITVAALILTHEHYSVDILAAYFVTYAIYSFMKKRGWLEPSRNFVDGSP